ncbi:hypothetical protein L0B52_06230 [Suttonella sp. R2A3]|uniref:lipoprotein insertase outer membrane protein LolB n=1 Tax=Suttonella sp. R2A3 TaxID=2908648 RepID=UPI001F3D2490|nr:lipoprotein insertase outer membrane protein LolB [Suttonella sp. R2A3]UJF23938.1 hypothetical protein L0B52_06230 [Suttonella sp. R2A3]
MMTFFRKKHHYAVLALAMLALSCVSTAPINEQISTAQWSADGRMALKYPFCREYQACEPRAVNAAFFWRHLDADESLTLFDPSGQAQLQLDYQGDQVRVREGQEEQWLSVDELTSRLGLPLPLADVATWLREEKTQTEWREAGWQVRVSDWRGSYYRRLDMTREDYRVRLLIDEMRSL